MELTFDYVNSELRYEPETGLLFRKIKRGGYNWLIPAGTLRPNGYIQLKLSGKLFRAHRIAWLLSTGKWPQEQIDHINGDRKDNRFLNLREATNRENGRNRVKSNKGNISGILGVSFSKSANKWNARIRIGEKEKNLGYFTNLNEAKIVRQSAEKEYFGDFAPKII